MRNFQAGLVLIILIALSCQESIKVPRGTYSSSQTFAPGTYHVDRRDIDSDGLIVVRGDNIILDFSGVTIDARADVTTPDQFSGVGIFIDGGSNITIRNAHLHGFKIAILAKNVDSLKLENCNLSYNYRPRLNSHWDRESLTDWLYYHDNEQDNWLRYGAGAYLKNCSNAVIKGLEIKQGFNGLLMTSCSNALIYNNNFSYNSGLGIGMYRSSNNRIMHNRLDWNVRGYSHGQYERGQDSAGILLYEQSSDNVIAYNSATHSGDGLFLWAGQETMDSGEGGCNNNLIYRNDFSHSVANAIEVTFSSNIIIENILNDSRYGIWGGYSHHTLIDNNEIRGCEFGIAIEHGNFNNITNNQITQTELGIQLWARESQPDGWGFAEYRDVSSKDYHISGNHFDSVDIAFDIASTNNMEVENNTFGIVNSMNKPSGIQPVVNDLDGNDLLFPDPLPDGINVFDIPLPARGRKYIMVNQWGPYDFQYPHLQLRSMDTVDADIQYVFGLFGPRANWELTHSEGFNANNTSSGALPSTLVMSRPLSADRVALEVSNYGAEHIDQFGQVVARGASSNMTFNQFSGLKNWEVVFQQIPDSISNLTSDQFSLSFDNPITSLHEQTLQYRWWRAPAEQVPADRFITRATTEYEFEPGNYHFSIESDDGVRFLLDGVVVLERWDVHTPAIDSVTLQLNGVHALEVQHFDAGGLAVLDLALEIN